MNDNPVKCKVPSSKYQQIARLALRSFKADEVRFVSFEASDVWIRSRLSSEDKLSDLVTGKDRSSHASYRKSFYVLDLAETGHKLTQELENCLRSSQDRNKVRFLAASVVHSCGVIKGYLSIFGDRPRQLFSIVDQELLQEMAGTLGDVLFPYFEGGDIIEDHTQIAFGVFSQLQDPLKRVSNSLEDLHASFQSSLTPSSMMHDYESQLKILNHVMEHSLAVALIAVDTVKDTDRLVCQSAKDFHTYVHQTAVELAEAFHMQPPPQCSLQRMVCQEKVCYLPAALWLSMYSTFHTASQRGCNGVEVQLTFSDKQQQRLSERSFSGFVLTMDEDDDDYPVSYSPLDAATQEITLSFIFSSLEEENHEDEEASELQESIQQDWRYLMPALLEQVGGIRTTACKRPSGAR